MTPPKVEQPPQETETAFYPDELDSYRPSGCINTIRLLKWIEEEGEDVWFDDR